MISPRTRGRTQSAAAAQVAAATAPEPHWPLETQTASVHKSRTTRAMFVGLNRCLPPTRKTNLLPTAITAAATQKIHSELRRRRIRERPEIRALRNSKASAREAFPSAWTPSAVPRIAIIRVHSNPNSSETAPQEASPSSTAICAQRGSFMAHMLLMAAFPFRKDSVNHPPPVGRRSSRTFREHNPVPQPSPTRPSRVHNEPLASQSRFKLLLTRLRPNPEQPPSRERIP